MRVAMKRYFTLEYWLDEGWYVGRLKEVPGVFSQGETLEELMANVQEVYQLMMDETMPVPAQDIRTAEIGLEV
jgi:predicted RNase H-like HicB family nuclease